MTVHPFIGAARLDLGTDHRSMSSINSEPMIHAAIATPTGHMTTISAQASIVKLRPP